MQEIKLTGFKAFLEVHKALEKPHLFKCKYCGDKAERSLIKIDDWPACCGYLMVLEPKND